jgi:hypothetical protein
MNFRQLHPVAGGRTSDRRGLGKPAAPRKSGPRHDHRTQARLSNVGPRLTATPIAERPASPGNFPMAILTLARPLALLLLLAALLPESAALAGRDQDEIRRLHRAKQILSLEPSSPITAASIPAASCWKRNWNSRWPLCLRSQNSRR